jgi:hypothetical protein
VYSLVPWSSSTPYHDFEFKINTSVISESVIDRLGQRYLGVAAGSSTINFAPGDPHQVLRQFNISGL